MSSRKEKAGSIDEPASFNAMGALGSLEQNRVGQMILSAGGSSDSLSGETNWESFGFPDMTTAPGAEPRGRIFSAVSTPVA